MFLRIEGNVLINLALISRVELTDWKKSAKLSNAGVYEVDSEIAYEFLTNPLNAGFVMVPMPVADPLPKQEAA